MNLRYEVDDATLTAEAFLELVQQIWPRDYDRAYIQRALARTCNITAWDGRKLVGCVRILTDGYLFGTIPEILVAPAYRRQGIGSHLLALAWDASPTSLFLGAQPGNEGFFEKTGFTKSMQSYMRKKERP